MLNYTQASVLGYKLIDNGLGVWSVTSSFGSFTGSLKEVCRHSVSKLGFSLRELEIGILEMEKNFDNVAEYGIMKTFIYSYEDKNEKSTVH